MRIIILTHPPALSSTSMPRFACLIGEGMRLRGHDVHYLTSSSLFGRLTALGATARKWLGYIDQFLIFPWLLRRRVRASARDTIFVVSDQALGMWVPSLKTRPNVIHCHDFLAQRSALSEFPQNPTAWSGRQYQALIRRGYRQGRNFISVSNQTRADLHRFLDGEPKLSEVVYNPLNYPFEPMPRAEALRRLSESIGICLEKGFILHVGGNQWYKNRDGVVRIYHEYCDLSQNPLPLVLVGPTPNGRLRELLAAKCTNGGRILQAIGLKDAEVHAAYVAARVLLFPSLEEGFGWPIIEAQACGCPVLTTNKEPMTEVGGDAVIYLPRRPDVDANGSWARVCGESVMAVLDQPDLERQQLIAAGLRNALRFDREMALRRFETLYTQVIASSLES